MQEQKINGTPRSIPTTHRQTASSNAQIVAVTTPAGYLRAGEKIMMQAKERQDLSASGK